MKKSLRLQKKHQLTFKEQVAQTVHQIKKVSTKLPEPINLIGVKAKDLKQILSEQYNWLRDEEIEKKTEIEEEDYDQESSDELDLNEDIFEEEYDEYENDNNYQANSLNNEDDEIEDDAPLEVNFDDEEELKSFIDYKLRSLETMQEYFNDQKKFLDFNDFDNPNPQEDVNAPEQETHILQIEDGKHLEINRSKGLKHGSMRITTKEDLPEMDIEFTRDKLEGTAKFYYPDGALERSIEFLDGKIHGQMQVFNPNGTPFMEIAYEHGVMHGPYKMYTEEGELSVISNYTHGKLDGEMIAYAHNVPYLKRTYKDGVEIHQEYNIDVAQTLH